MFTRQSHTLYHVGLSFYVPNKCETIKQNESEIENNILSFLLDVILLSNSYILQKTPLKLDMSFQSYDLLKGHQNNRKQKDLFPLFGSISKSIFASSDSFCLITPHIRGQTSNAQSHRVKEHDIL